MIIKQLKNVGPETWIMLAGALFLIIVIIVAMVPGDTGFGSAASHTPVQSRPSGAAVNGPMPQNRTVARCGRYKLYLSSAMVVLSIRR